MSIVTILIGLYRRHWLWLILGITLSLLTALASVALLTLSGWFITAAALAGLAGTAASFDLFRPGALVRLFALLRTGGRYGERLLTHEATLRLLATLRVWFYQRLEPLAPMGLQRYRSGDLLSRLVADIDALDHLYLRLLLPTGTALLTLLVVAVGLSFLDHYLALSLSLALLIGSVLVSLTTQRLAHRAAQALSIEGARLRVALVDYCQGIAELLAFGQQEAQQAKIAQQQRCLFDHQQRLAFLAGISNGLMLLLCGLVSAVALYWSLLLFQADRLSAGLAAMLPLMTLGLLEVLAPLPAAYQLLGQSRMAMARLQQLVVTPPPVQFPARSPSAFCPGPLTFEGVSFSHSALPLLANATATIAAGERVAIVGPSGCGKSTLAQLLVRFYDPQQGRILINGIDLQRLSETDLRQTVAYLPQRPHLFNATLRDNLLIAGPAAQPPSDEALYELLAMVELAALIRDLPDGLDTLLGESGTRFSGGQAKRIALAQMALRESAILILDEPTVGLDRALSQRVLARLLRHWQGRTVLVISHHQDSFLAPFDRVLTLTAGKLSAASTAL